MGIEATFFCYLVALIAFVLLAFSVGFPRVNVLGVGLAFAILPTFWASLEAL